jgi:hypothetical protein
MAEVVSGRNLTTIVLSETEVEYLRDVLSDVEIRSRKDEPEASKQIAVLYSLWTAVSDAEQFESDDSGCAHCFNPKFSCACKSDSFDDLLTAAGESYHFREPDLAEPDGK